MAKVGFEPATIQLSVRNPTGAPTRPMINIVGVCPRSLISFAASSLYTVRCDVGDWRTPQFESSTFTYDDTNRAPKTADVVFIVQHSPSNKDILEKVKGLVDDLEKAMRAENLTNTRYSIVGFGGKDHLQSPHSHTMDSQIFNSANKVVQGLSRLNLEAGVVSDPMDAIRFAAKLAFRPGASKTFILLASDSCPQDSTRFRDLQVTLSESDIKLHILIQDVFKLKSNSAKTAYIFGKSSALL